MPEIYHHSHPYYSPGDGRYQSASVMHQIIFGKGIEHSFPEQIHILCGHNSTWFHMCAEYSNKRSDKFYDDFSGLGEFIRNYMVDDVFISQKEVKYNFPEGEDHKPWKIQYEDYYRTGEDGKLIRLPVECIIGFISIRFRNEVDKTQFQLMNDGQFIFMDELEADRIEKIGESHYDKSRDILCPLCKVNYNENNNKNKEDTSP